MGEIRGQRDHRGRVRERLLLAERKGVQHLLMLEQVGSPPEPPKKPALHTPGLAQETVSNL